MTGVTLPDVYPPLIPLIQETYNGKSERYFVKIKLRRDPMLYMSDLYELKKYLFDNGNLEEFLLFVCNFNMTLTTSGTLETGAKVQYRRMLVHGEAFFSLTYCLMTCKVRTP